VNRVYEQAEPILGECLNGAAHLLAQLGLELILDQLGAPDDGELLLALFEQSLDAVVAG
jgi:hypothetical protein